MSGEGGTGRLGGGIIIRALLVAKWGFEALVRFIGPLFVMLATGLITTVIVIHYRALIPYHTDYFSFSILESIWKNYGNGDPSLTRI
jgi:hypothetical protein